MMENRIDLTVNIAGLSLKNPVIAASGTFGFGREYSAFFNLSRLGGIAVKGLTLKPRKGNPPPRIAETPAGILNSVGLQNPGVHAFIRDEIPFLRRYETAIIANASGNTVEEYEEMVSILSEADVDAVELNLSCPNVKEGCLVFGSSVSGITQVVSRVRKLCKKPLIVKLTPNVTDISEIACAAEAAGADAVSLINTLLGMAIDAKTRRPVLGNVTGRLSSGGKADSPQDGLREYQSGKDTRDRHGRHNHRYRHGRVPACRRVAVMIGTAGFVNPYAWVEAVDGLERYMLESGVKSVSELIGGLMV